MRLLDVTANSGLTVADAEGAANLLMLVVVLTQSFALPVLYGTETEVLVAADARECRFREHDAARFYNWHACNPRDHFEWGNARYHQIMSYRLADSSWMSICFFNVALTLGGSCLLCLYFNRSRTCPVFFRRWYRVFKWWVVAGYCMFYCGLQVFFGAMADLTVAIYPNYDPRLFFNTTTGTMIQDDSNDLVLYRGTYSYYSSVLVMSFYFVVFSVLVTLVMAYRSVTNREVRAELEPYREQLESHGLSLNTLAMVEDDGALMGLLEEAGVQRVGDRIRIAAAVRAAGVASWKGLVRKACCCCRRAYDTAKTRSQSREAE